MVAGVCSHRRPEDESPGRRCGGGYRFCPLTAVCEHGPMASGTRQRSGRTSAPTGLEAMSDEDLVDLARDARPGAFEELYRRYQPVVTAVAVYQTSRTVDVSDIVQETFVRAWDRLGSLRQGDRFRPWVLQICRREIIDQHRRAARRPRLDGDDEVELDRLPTVDGAPEAEVEGADLHSRIHAGMERLSVRDATAITLASQFGFGPTEIAEALGVSPNTAKVVLHRARRRLREHVRI